MSLIQKHLADSTGFTSHNVLTTTGVVLIRFRSCCSMAAAVSHSGLELIVERNSVEAVFYNSAQDYHCDQIQIRETIE